jgi:biotin transport system substrate-specific component
MGLGIEEVGSVLAERYKNKRYNFFKWRNETNVVYKVIMSLCMAYLTGLGSMIRFYLPFTPVPITLQVFFVLLSGVVLGARWGGLSQAIYVALGTLGVPWFALSYGLMGVTGGYLIGFILTSTMIGWLTEKNNKFRIFPGIFGLMLLGVGIIYAFGALQFSLVMGTNIWETISLAILPFIPGDLIKAFSTATIGYVIMPKESFC